MSLFGEQLKDALTGTSFEGLVPNQPEEPATEPEDSVAVALKNGNPRLESVHGSEKAEAAALVVLKYDAQSQGKWGWSGKTPSARKDSEKGGARILYNSNWMSNGGGLFSTMMVLWIPKGGSVGLSDDSSCTFDGERTLILPGGALSIEDDPSRN